MRVFSVNMGADTGGVSIAARRAFEDIQPPGWTWRSMVSSTNYIGYPRDLPWDPAAAQDEWRAADVLHFHNSWRTAQRFEAGYRSRHQLPRKPAVITYHGTGFREAPSAYLTEQIGRGALGAVTTLDMWLLAPRFLTWTPPAVDVAWLQELRAMHYRPEPLVIVAHAPTNREIKGTGHLLEVVDQLRHQAPIVIDLIEQTDWTSCLRRKARADIYVDQLELGYGMNALEAWAMGIPVIAGAAPATKDEMRRRFGELPFVDATEASLHDVLARLIWDPDERADAGRRGLEYVRRYHAHAPVVQALTDLYIRAAA